ncbi:hypothetical protein [Brunnivagina elsteri]|nr:hypothetical protein [Calothrix elsteri]
MESERERLKQACDSANTNMSHLSRSLLIKWLTEQIAIAPDDQSKS